MESSGAAAPPLIFYHTSILHLIGSAMDLMMERMD
jgi:hypothetical protein